MKFIRIFCSLAIMLSGFALKTQAQIFYKVEIPDSDKPSYILGTHHFAPISVIDSIAQLHDILKSVDRLYGELDMQKMLDPSVMMEMQSLMVAPPDSTLDKLLTPAQLDSVASVWNEYAGGTMPFEMLKGVKPALISTQLASLITMKFLPEIDPLEGIDMTMQNRAREAGIPVEGLETIDFQINLLYGTPIEYQAASLLRLVRGIGDEEQKVRQLTEDYLAGNIDGILKEMLDSDGDEPEIAKRLIFNRNRDWVDKLVKIMPRESVMVVVGAGHLPGDRGVLEGLKNAGFLITPIR